jgi:hypothetical protein
LTVRDVLGAGEREVEEGKKFGLQSSRQQLAGRRVVSKKRAP